MTKQKLDNCVLFCFFYFLFFMFFLVCVSVLTLVERPLGWSLCSEEIPWRDSVCARHARSSSHQSRRRDGLNLLRAGRRDIPVSFVDGTLQSRWRRWKLPRSCKMKRTFLAESRVVLPSHLRSNHARLTSHMLKRQRLTHLR